MKTKEKPAIYPMKPYSKTDKDSTIKETYELI